ncbi:hypothetical protein OV208_21370 [Corallococcus sp. bb12-1]|uniref:hypothetical protein n=1 Tax=Corallococcus sp. bb12-1 TaxID=2996784 RepID=UPI00226E5C0B|nr:hypothetical protein [Corallococcus sp. bb12-1]MCY1043881.1 hypothetical protein [Corallococcus sp. bb12-1]
MAPEAMEAYFGRPSVQMNSIKEVSTVVANFPNPDGNCQPFPANASALVGWSNVENVVAYWTDDCSGQPIALGTLRTFQPGEYASFTTF